MKLIFTVLYESSFRRILTQLLALLLGTLAAIGSVAAQGAYPSQPVRMIVGFPPGGSTDGLARIVANDMSQQMPQRVMIENKPGAGANIAAEYVANSPNDGYTLLFTHVATHGIAPAVYSSIPYDPIKDFTAVSLLATSPLMLLCSSKVPVSNMAELLSWAKKAGRPLTIGYPGNGTSGHLSSALLAQKSGMNLTLIPYRGGAPATQDLLGGQIDLLFDPLNSAIQLSRSGHAKALGVTSPERNPAVPDIPVLAETMPGFSVLTWFGIVAPAGTSSAVIDTLAVESARAVNSPEVKKQLLGMGMTPVGSTPAEFTDWIRKELAHWAGIAKAANIKIE